MKNTLIKEFKTQLCPELSWRCTARSNWYSASCWFYSASGKMPPGIRVLRWNHRQCLLTSFDETISGPTCFLFATSKSDKDIDSSPWNPSIKPSNVSAALHVSHFSPTLCSWRSGFVFVPCAGMCAYAEIEDVSFTLLDAARPMQASLLRQVYQARAESGRPNSWLQACYIVIARTTRRPDGSSRWASVACCRSIVWNLHWPGQGTTCRLLLQRGLLHQRS